ncbi:MAG: NADH-quinone oxidoreductase subunit H [Chloroflexi bacterium]|nr:NADH-quinone oxidoreductase subunit H [Chloroflexota bacterium]MDA8187745.1 NADH-quinone oxidoreductase subunit H [Dehalococcoidales bacterium]
MNLTLLLANLVLALAVAPLLNGVIKKSKAGWQNRCGPGVLQPWFDIWKYLGRESVVSEHASWLFRLAPYVYFGAHLAAAGMVPMVLVGSPLAGMGDVIVLVGLLALARFALALAALDTASNFGGMGTSRELAFASLVEPALFLALFSLAIPVGSTALGALVGDGGVTVARLLALGVFFIVAVAETGRIPVDNPDTHLELTMAHEGMLLEYSGRPLGLLLWGTHIKQLVILSLLAALFFPWGIASDPSAASLAVGMLTYLAKLGLLGLALALVETTNVKMRIFRVPDLLGAASLLGLLAITSIYVVGG